MDDVTKIVPKRHFMFLSVLLTSDAGESEDVDETTRRLSLSIAQDIIYAVSKGKSLTPKHVGLGMTIHQATRSKSLVNMFNKAGHCINYSQVQRIDTSIAKQILETCTETDVVAVPTNLTEGRFLQFSADNIDIIEETLDGRGTFHATQMIAFQRGAPLNRIQKELHMGQERSLKVPAELQQLTQAPKYTSRAQPQFAEDVKLESYKPDPIIVKKANTKDLSWLLVRHFSEQYQKVPSWTGFNQLITKDTQETTTIAYFPIINAPAYERDTLWTTILRCLRITQELNPGQTTVLTLDEQLYAKLYVSVGKSRNM